MPYSLKILAIFGEKVMAIGGLARIRKAGVTVHALRPVSGFKP
jgi:hypothetical protein